MSTASPLSSSDKFKLLCHVLNSAHTVCWQWDVVANVLYWDETFNILLGYHPGEVTPSVKLFLQWLHPEDKRLLTGHLKSYLEQGIPYQVTVRLRHKDGSYRWYESTGDSPVQQGTPAYMMGILRDVHEERENATTVAEYGFLAEEAGRLSKVGGWMLKLLPEPDLRWTDEVYRIHELPVGSPVTAEQAVQYYHPHSLPLIQDALQSCIADQRRFDLQIQLITATGRNIWVHAMGKPILNKGNTEAVHGVFQDITEQKLKQLKLEQSLSIISEQNKRLQTFAQMVSHNLRSHSSTLRSVLDLRQMSDDLMDQTFFDESLHKISDALSNTIQELNDIVQIQSKPNISQRELRFEDVFNDVIVVLGSLIRTENARVESNFVNCSSIIYNPAYLESILLNLISNAIKYRRPDQPTLVQVKTFLMNGHCVLEVKDNGLGMDLEMMGGKLFGMYQTFHGNNEANGLGLFLVQSQVEALGGRIEVSSKLRKGSTFTVFFQK